MPPLATQPPPTCTPAPDPRDAAASRSHTLGGQRPASPKKRAQRGLLRISTVAGKGLALVSAMLVCPVFCQPPGTLDAVASKAQRLGRYEVNLKAPIVDYTPRRRSRT